jgi:hypothetical protein|tara:strand:+ start:47 stop:196 length:150 start_codon:yes stop_codon:yes gene_type:complete
VETEHFSKPKLMLLTPDDPDTDFIFGLTGNSVLAKLTAPDIDAVRQPVE